jgi:hypothetical protein
MIVLDVFKTVLLDDQVKIFANRFVLVVLDPNVEILLGMHEDLFLTLLVFEAEFVEAVASLGRVGLECALGLFIGEGIRGHVVHVVNPAGDDGAIGITFQKTDNHFLTDAGDPHGAPILPRPGLGNANPAGGVVVLFAQAVPEKLHLHTAIFVFPDFLTILL